MVKINSFDYFLSQMRISEMEMTKARNMIIHHEEILSRPPKSWIKKGAS